MNNQKKLVIAAMLIFLFAGCQIFAQDFTVDMGKLEKSYSVNLTRPFTITFKDTAKSKTTVAIKQGNSIPILLKETADLSQYKIQFSQSDGGWTVKDKDDKDKNISNKVFVIQFSNPDKKFSVNPSNGTSTAAKFDDIIVDIGAEKKAYKADFEQNFKISFKQGKAKPKDEVVISIRSGEAEQKLTIKPDDLTKLQISFVSARGGVLTVDDGEGKARNDDQNKPFKIDNGEFTLTVGGKSFNISKAVVEKKPKKSPGTVVCPPVTIIDASMLAGLNGSAGCQLCDIRSTKVAIESKKDRKYSTDYIVIYDPMLKKDAYTICKHVFEKIKNTGRNSMEKLRMKGVVINSSDKYIERYIKIGPKWFAPHVGSQIRFEVVNLPLNLTFNLSVNENDIFNTGAGQFASVINNLVNSNIIGPLTGAAPSRDTATAAEDTAKSIQGGNDEACFLSDIDHIAADLLKYMTAFRISSCAIEQHNVNLPIILAKINTKLQLSAATAEQLELQLTQKIEEEVGEENQVKAVKKSELIVNALKAMENVEPLAYTTLRAKNRDYIEVRYTKANNVLSKPENIRMSGGMKIDFSAGFVLTGLRDYSYVLKNIKYPYTPQGTGQTERDTTGNVIVKEDEGSNQVGVGMLTHFYPRSSSHYNFGGTVGLMTSTSLNLRLMLGGSLMVSSLFGSNNRVSFSGGVVWGKVKRLSEKDKEFYNGPRVLNKIPEFFTEASAPAPIDRNEHSWFFAVTLNFGGN